MERFRRRKSHARASSLSKATTIINRSSDYNRTQKVNQLIAESNNYLKVPFDSGCGSGYITKEEDQLTYNLGRSDLQIPASTQMKKLLADELTKDSLYSRQPPSIIAKLMGLDGMPPQHKNIKQQKRHPDDYQQKKPAGHHKGTKLYDSRSRRKNMKEQEYFKDVYEVVDCSRMEAGRYPDLVDPNLKGSRDEMAFIRQKFMDVKRLSTDEKFQDSKEFHDALEVLDSNKDLLLKFLQEPDSLFARHLNDLHGTPKSHCRHVRSRSASNALKHNIDAIGSQLGREASQKIDISSSHRHHSGHHSDFQYRNGKDHYDPYDILAEGKEYFSSNPNRIVVLKPNVGHVLPKSISSPSSSNDQLDIEFHKGRTNIRQPKSEMGKEKSLPNDLEICEHKSRESRELAREITRQMRSKLGKDSFTLDLSGYQGYSADESSHELSGNDSSYESEAAEVGLVTPLKFSVRNKLSKSSAPRNAESSVSREAKKRLSERWKMTQRSQEARMGAKGSTLGEMLAIPDVDMRPVNSDTVVAHKSFGRLGRADETVGRISPLGISSRDGWKEGCIEVLSRSRSLPASSNHLGTPKANKRHEALAAERHLIQKQAIGRERKKLEERDFYKEGGSSSRRTRSGHKHSKSSVDIYRQMVDDIEKTQLSGKEMQKVFDGGNSPDVKGVILETSSRSVGASLNPNTADDVEQSNGSDSLKFPDRLSPKPELTADVLHDGSSSCDLKQERSARYHGEDSAWSHCPATQPESPVSSKEANQPSPVSVLEAPCVEDNSSGSECFERVSAELHGLRLQLQLLKQESQAYDEASMLISSDEENAEVCPHLSERNGLLGSEEKWELTYLFNVLIHSGLDETDPDLFMASWHSLECPVDPLIFEKLEKRYLDEVWGSRSERKLLFDRINSGIIEILEKFHDPYPWVGPVTRCLGPRWKKDKLRTELEKCVSSCETSTPREAIDEVVQRTRWLELGDDIDTIGREIENILLEDLAAEAVVI